jgi:hypothetical protein
MVPEFFYGEENNDALSVLILVGKFRTIIFPTDVTETEAKCSKHGQDSKRLNAQQKGLTAL